MPESSIRVRRNYAPCMPGHSNGTHARPSSLAGPRLDVVVPLAERLPVIAIPEQRLISAVRYSVINNACRCCASVTRALITERMRAQMTAPGFLPLRAVASLCRRTADLVMLARSVPEMLCAAQSLTNATWARRCVGHLE